MNERTHAKYLHKDWPILGVQLEEDGKLKHLVSPSTLLPALEPGED